MKKSILAAFGFAAIALGGSATLAGTEVGSGVPDVTKRLPRYNSSRDADLYSYCADALSALIRKVRFSMLPENGFARKRQLVVEGMRDALRAYQNWPEDFEPMTREALKRGLKFNEVFNSDCESSQCRLTENRRAYNYMLIYANHVINKIAPLDQFYYIPLRMNEDCYYFNSCRTEVYYDSFLDYYKDAASSLLELYVDPKGNTGLPNAFATDLYELKAAELIFTWASEDLNDSYFRRGLSCTYQDLRQTARDIHSFLNGQDEGFGSSPNAVKIARSVAASALHHLKNTECRPPREVYPRRYDEHRRSSERYELPSLIYRN